LTTTVTPCSTSFTMDKPALPPLHMFLSDEEYFDFSFTSITWLERSFFNVTACNETNQIPNQFVAHISAWCDETLVGKVEIVLLYNAVEPHYKDGSTPEMNYWAWNVLKFEYENDMILFKLRWS